VCFLGCAAFQTRLPHQLLHSLFVSAALNSLRKNKEKNTLFFNIRDVLVFVLGMKLKLEQLSSMDVCGYNV
jgi:hypothetical protein